MRQSPHAPGSQWYLDEGGNRADPGETSLRGCSRGSSDLIGPGPRPAPVRSRKCATGFCGLICPGHVQRDRFLPKIRRVDTVITAIRRLKQAGHSHGVRVPECYTSACSTKPATAYLSLHSPPNFQLPIYPCLTYPTLTPPLPLKPLSPTHTPPLSLFPQPSYPYAISPPPPHPPIVSHLVPPHHMPHPPHHSLHITDHPMPSPFLTLLPSAPTSHTCLISRI